MKNKKYTFRKINYELEKDYKSGFDSNEVESKITEYFDNYDYIVGDWSYGKLRLKGFYDKNKKECNNINDISNLDNYIRDNCSYDCKYFVLKKVV